jgi:hypothetical protein
MRYDVHPTDLPEVGAEGGGDLACGDDMLEVRIGEHALLEWWMVCAVMRIFEQFEL